VASQMRSDLFSSVVRQDVAFFDCHRSGEIVSRLTADVQDFKSSFKMVISQGLRSATQVFSFESINRLTDSHLKTNLSHSENNICESSSAQMLHINSWPSFVCRFHSDTF